MYKEALDHFAKVLEQARQTDNIREPAAATLATVGETGQPAARVVLLKDFDTRGFNFYTNRKSRKGRHLSANPRASLCFYWDILWKQAIVEGRVERLPEEECDLYWSTRPRLSQVGAWASLQSQPLPSRAVLLARVARYEAQHLGSAVPRPPHWSGFRIIPDRIEFWSGRPFRLHLRLLYQKSGEGWTKERLYP